MKRFFLIFSFFCIFSFSISKPIFAETPSTENEKAEETKKSGWDQFWEDFFNSIININNGLNWFIPQKNTQISCGKKTNFTDYNAKDQDAVSRSQSASNQKYQKGTYLKAIIDGVYDDSTIAYMCNNSCTNDKTSDSDCTDIKYSTLVYYFYKKNEEILYDKSNSKDSIGYDSTKMDSYKYTIPTDADSSFRNLYNNISQIPQGAYQGKADTAAGSSSELNNSMRNPIAASAQTEKPPSDVTKKDNAEKIIKDTDGNQQILYSSLTSAESHKVLGTSTSSLNSNSQVLGTSTDTDALKKIFTNSLHPASWQKNESSETTSPDTPSIEKIYPIEEDNNNPKDTSRGMSQMGAVGMALYGLSYEEIIKNYYGDVKIVDIKNYVSDPNNIDITVRTNNEDSDTTMRNKTITIDLEEKYLQGIDEIQDYYGNKGAMNMFWAQAIVSRTYALVRSNGFKDTIPTSNSAQIFNYGKIGKLPNLSQAVKDTKGLIIVDTTTNQPFKTEFKAKFCGPSYSETYTVLDNNGKHTNPSYKYNKSYENVTYQHIYSKSIDSACN